ncbi:MAG: hypothetical protein WCC48_13215 [Anaeromyxobacteraceae bacterium]
MQFPHYAGRLVALCAALIALRADAQARQFGAWATGVMDGNKGVFAATINDSGGLLGQYCYRESGSCLWLLANDADCEDGAKYPVLLNTDSGAANATIRCVKLDGKARYVFEAFNVIDDAVRSASWFGIAFPMVNGRFQVSRFSMQGAAQAVSLMRKAAEASAKPATSTTKDLSL